MIDHKLTVQILGVADDDARLVRLVADIADAISHHYPTADVVSVDVCNRPSTQTATKECQ